jgi:membrane-bound acyltransferase YfiQ involved in biofilm formation
VSVHQNHPFVNNVRFWSMFSIIAIHCIWSPIFSNDDLRTHHFQFTLVQILKFGSIDFFLISGFLLGERIDQCSSWHYLRRRLRKIGGPWVFWAGISVIGLFIEDQFTGRLAGLSLPSQLWQRIDQIFVASIYWFVPNMLFALGILLLFRRLLDHVSFGLVLGAFSAFYGINAYFSWFASDHKVALFGFAFYLWLGTQAARHFDGLLRFLERIPLWILLTADIALCFIAYKEGCYLLEHTMGDPENTLRIPNQLFSISVALTLIKVRPIWPSFIDVQANTFGQYLIHPILLKLLRAPITLVATFFSQYLVGSPAAVWDNPVTAFAVWTTMFGLCYGGALLLTKALIGIRLGGLVGHSAPKPIPILVSPRVEPLSAQAA